MSTNTGTGTGSLSTGTDGASESSAHAMSQWWKVATEPLPATCDGRLHVCIEGRYLTIFKHRGALSAIDAICHHAGGPLTQGTVKDIEDLGVAVVLCPWHKFMVTIDTGKKAYQGVDFIAGKPVNTGWKIGKVVQRVHEVYENSQGIYVRLDNSPEDCPSDKDTCNPLCAKPYAMHPEEPIQMPP